MLRSITTPVLIIIIIIFGTLQLKSQSKIGIIVMFEDSLITHVHTGLTIITYFKNDTTLPFGLEQNCRRIVDSVFFDKKNEFELIWLEREVSAKYNNMKRSLNGRDFKTYQKSFFEELKRTNNIEAFLAITNMDLNLMSGAYANNIETQKICISSGVNKTKAIIYIRIKSNLIWNNKIYTLKGKSYNIFIDDFPKISKNDEDIIAKLVPLENDFSDLIQLQIEELKDWNVFDKMQSYLRHMAALKKYKELHPK